MSSRRAVAGVWHSIGVSCSARLRASAGASVSISPSGVSHSTSRNPATRTGACGTKTRRGESSRLPPDMIGTIYHICGGRSVTPSVRPNEVLLSPTNTLRWRMASRIVPPELLDRVVAHFHPQRVILFGSAARGEAGSESDIDLLVVVDDDTPPEAFRAKSI